jgi:methionyl-tRNA synthetase
MTSPSASIPTWSASTSTSPAAPPASSPSASAASCWRSHIAERFRADLPGLEAAEEIAAHYEARDYARAIRRIMALADQVNQYVDKNQPWQLAKQEGQERQLHQSARS